jgi:DNA replication licensing factor MCM2
VNKQSLEVAYHHLSNEEASLAIWVADCPTHMLPLFNEVAREVTLMLFESYDQIHHSIFVRITHLPVVDRIRDIRCALTPGDVRVSHWRANMSRGVFPSKACFGMPPAVATQLLSLSLSPLARSRRNDNRRIECSFK